jgi:hypothetical protein
MEDALLSGRVKLMPMIKRFARMAWLLLGLVAEANSQAGAVPGAEWRQLATPERAGWSATRLAEIRGYVEEMGSTSAMIVRHGVVVGSWGDVGHRSNLHSCRKSLLNALIGIAVASGAVCRSVAVARSDHCQPLGWDLTKREIHKGQISRLVEMVVAAAPAN